MTTSSVPWGAIGSTVGSMAGGYLGQQAAQENQTLSSSSGSIAHMPPSIMGPMGFLAGNAFQLGQQPAPYFPGQGYVGPSAPTQFGVGMGMQGAQAYGNAANAMGATSPYYTRAAESGAAGFPFYPQAANANRNAAPMYQRAGAAGLWSIPGQANLLNQAQGNYGFLTNAADVANNPYVQNMLDVNQERVNQNFTENLLPAINQGAASVNQLGSSRHALAQAKGAELTANQLAQANSGLMMNAYGQGLGAQQNALGQTGAMLNNMLSPAQTASWAAGQQGAAANQLSLAGQQYGLGMNQLGAAGDWATKGANNLALRAGLFNQGANTAINLGQNAVEPYQQAALQDQLNRYNAMFQEPWQRMSNMQQAIQPFHSYARQYAGGQQTNPAAMSPTGGFLQGAGMGSNLGGQLGSAFGNWWNSRGNSGSTVATAAHPMDFH